MEPTFPLSMAFFPLVIFAIWFAVVVFAIVVALRLVRGVERIAQALERRGP